MKSAFAEARRDRIRGLLSGLLAKTKPAEGGRSLAGSTGLEPAASGVTGRRSNQLNYDPDTANTMLARFSRPTVTIDRAWSGWACGGSPAWDDEARVRRAVVGGTGLEPVT